MKKKGVSLIELVITVMLIAILCALGYIQYGNYREEAMGKEAKANLRLIIAAQRIYKIKAGAYYPIALGGGTETNEGTINNDLKVLLSTSAGATQAWDYDVKSGAPGPSQSTCAQATRVNGPAKTWSFTNNDADGDPNENGTCP